MDYKKYHNEVIKMQRRCKDWLDEPSHAQARQLEQSFQNLEDDVQVQKNIHTIRNHLKRIESMCRSMDDSVMSHDHVNEIEGWARNGLNKIR